MELKISPKFNIDDIHKIREYHYEITKNMTSQERIDWYNNRAKDFCKKNFPNAVLK